jgi:hypothetical protein
MEAMPDREVGHFFLPRCGDSAGRVQLEIPRPNFTSFSITKVELVKFGCCFTVLARIHTDTCTGKIIWLVLQYVSYICGSPINQTL